MTEASKGFLKRRWKWVAGGGVAIAAAFILAGARLASPEPRIPTAEVIQGSFRDFLDLRGDVKARRSVTLSAPMRAGQLMIMKLAPDGAVVKKGDVVVEFDSSALEQRLAEHQSALETAVAQIQQSKAQAKLTEQQDTTNLMTDRYTLQSAKLDASKQAILSKIDGEEAQIKVTDAELALKQAEEQLKLDRAADAADLADQQEKWEKAKFDVKRDQTALAQMSLRAPIAGVVSILTHWTPNGRQTYRLGDQTWSGANIVELPDLSTLYFDARADETDRSQLKVGQTALLQAPALPSQRFDCSVHQISTLASMDFSAPWPFPRNFEVEMAFSGENPKLRPGMTGTARVGVGLIPGAIQIPTRAVFQEDGHAVAFLLQGSKFQAQPIQLGHQGGGMVVVTAGLKPGQRVALQNPGAKD